MKRIVLLITAVALTCASASANAQSLLKKLGERAKNAAEQNIGNKVEKGVNDLLNGKVGKKEGSNNNQNNTQTQNTSQTAPASAGTVAASQRDQAGASAPQGKATPGSVPNPYTAFDIPENPFDVALGLPENQDSAEPALVVPSSKQSYAAFTYGGDGLRGKEFWNAERQRLFTVTFQKVNGEKIVDRSLTIVDSMAVYTIIDEEKLIIKMPLASIKSAAMHNVVKNEEVFSKNQLSTSQGRWCYKSAGGSVTTTKQGDREITEENSESSFYDLETGIVLEVKHGFGHDYTRNIHLGVYYPEIFDLPADYKMVVQNVAGGAQQWDAMNQKSQQMQDRVNQMGLENMSLEELMRRAK